MPDDRLAGRLEDRLELRAGVREREEPLAERARDVRGEADVRDAIAVRLAGKTP